MAFHIETQKILNWQALLCFEFEATRASGPFKDGYNLTTDKLLSKSDWKLIYKQIESMLNLYQLHSQTNDKTLILNGKSIQCVFDFVEMGSPFGSLITNLVGFNSDTPLAVFICVRIRHFSDVCTRTTTRTQEVNIVPLIPNVGNKSHLIRTANRLLSKQPMRNYDLRENPASTLKFQSEQNKKMKRKMKRKKKRKQNNSNLTVSVPRTARNQGVKIIIRRNAIDATPKRKTYLNSNTQNNISVDITEAEEDDDCVCIPQPPPPLICIESTDDEEY